MSYNILNAICVKQAFHTIRRTLATNSAMYSNKSSKLTVYTNKLDSEYETMEPVLKKQKELLETTTLTVTEPRDLKVINGVPEEHVNTRRVRICKPSKNAMQSGTENTHLWRLDFEDRERWENPLMGWTSTGDPLSNLNVWFATAEEAAEYCDQNGWHYEIEEPMPRRNLKKVYADNFSWNKRTRVGTK